MDLGQDDPAPGLEGELQGSSHRRLGSLGIADSMREPGLRLVNLGQALGHGGGAVGQGLVEQPGRLLLFPFVEKRGGELSKQPDSVRSLEEIASLLEGRRVARPRPLEASGPRLDVRQPLFGLEGLQTEGAIGAAAAEHLVVVPTGILDPASILKGLGRPEQHPGTGQLVPRQHQVPPHLGVAILIGEVVHLHDAREAPVKKPALLLGHRPIDDQPLVGFTEDEPQAAPG